MSIDFDSAALQTQQEEEEYDEEDYAREREVSVQLLSTDTQTLTDWPLSSAAWLTALNDYM